MVEREAGKWQQKHDSIRVKKFTGGGLELEVDRRAAFRRIHEPVGSFKNVMLVRNNKAAVWEAPLDLTHQMHVLELRLLATPMSCSVHRDRPMHTNMQSICHAHTTHGEPGSDRQVCVAGHGG